jgi:hypothetical protein
MPTDGSGRDVQWVASVENGGTTMTSQAYPVRPDPVVVAPRPATQRRSPKAGTVADDTDIVEVWGQDSFPASDPPANW